jgi:hypothetical protein
MSVENLSLLKSAVCPNTDGLNWDIGWEEHVNLGVCYLLKTTLAKSEKDRNVHLPSLDETMPDLAKLRRHLLLFFDRIRKNEGRIIPK